LIPGEFFTRMHKAPRLVVSKETGTLERTRQKPSERRGSNLDKSLFFGSCPIEDKERL
jgi:hypothetical protein